MWRLEYIQGDFGHRDIIFLKQYCYDGHKNSQKVFCILVIPLTQIIVMDHIETILSFKLQHQVIVEYNDKIRYFQVFKKYLWHRICHIVRHILSDMNFNMYNDRPLKIKSFFAFCREDNFLSNNWFKISWKHVAHLIARWSHDPRAMSWNPDLVCFSILTWCDSII